MSRLQYRHQVRIGYKRYNFDEGHNMGQNRYQNLAYMQSYWTLLHYWQHPDNNPVWRGCRHDCAHPDQHVVLLGDIYDDFLVDFRIDI